MIQLPDDIFLNHVFPLLDLESLFKLKLVPNKRMKQLTETSHFYKILYYRRFVNYIDRDTDLLFTKDINSSKSFNWKQRYLMRFHSKLVAFGDNGDNRLGLENIQLDSSEVLDNLGIAVSVSMGNLNLIPQYRWRNYLQNKNYIHYPTIVPGFENISLKQCSMGGIGTLTLTDQNNIFMMNSNQFRFNYYSHFRMVNSSFDEKNENKEAKLLNNYYSDLQDKEITQITSRIRKLYHLPNVNETKHLRILSISCGRFTFLGLDTDNNLWIWDNPLNPNGCKLVFIDPETDQIINNKILKFQTGWDLYSCMIEDIGILVWIKRENTYYEAKPLFKIIPTILTGKVIDYCLCENCLLFINENRKLFRIDFNDGIEFISNPYEILSFNNFHLPRDGLKFNNVSEATRSTENIQSTNKFIKIVGNYKHFAVFNDWDEVFIGNIDNITEESFNYSTDNPNYQYKSESVPQIFEELQHKNCLNVSIGDYHFLALFANGDVYSWGTEPKGCGCLGLGPTPRLRLKYEDDCDVELNMDCTIKKPKRVNLGENMFAMSISAMGWQSSVIVCNLEHRFA